MNMAADVRIVVKETGVVVADKAKIAEDYLNRSKGLLGRPGMDQGEGLVIRPCSSIHTFFMQFSIDVLFVDKNDRIIKIKSALKPWRLSGCLFGCRYVIELPEGAIAKSRIVTGNHVKYE